MPLDSFHREINYLRISVTDRCNLRCLYCMPMHDLAYASRDETLTAAEIEMVVRAAVDVGFSKFRLTGGEPTLRNDLVDIVRRIAGVAGVGDLAMTTNGILLPRLANDLRRAGLRRLNIHVDTLNPGRIGRLMRFADAEAVMAGIEAAAAAGFSPIKLNSVIAREHNDVDAVDLARLTLERDWHVRFIELMPLGEPVCAGFSLDRYVSNVETMSRIEHELGRLTPVENANASDEARNYRLSGARGLVGFISPVSEPYCATCNRMRLTVDGKLHLCLLNDDEIDLKPALRNGGADEHRLREFLRRGVTNKPVGHHLDRGVYTRERGMYQIGG